MLVGMLPIEFGTGKASREQLRVRVMFAKPHSGKFPMRSVAMVRLTG